MGNETTKKIETVTFRKSFNGASNIQPAPGPALSTVLPAPSFDGAAKLQPPPAATTPTSTYPGLSQTQGDRKK